MNEATSEASSPINQFTTAETRTTPLGEHSQGDVDDTHRYFRRTDVTPSMTGALLMRTLALALLVAPLLSVTITTN